MIDNETSLCGFGVPQGLILGPVLFNLYVSDLSENVTHSKTLQYADDTKIYIHAQPADAEFKAVSVTTFNRSVIGQLILILYLMKIKPKQ